MEITPPVSRRAKVENPQRDVRPASSARPFRAIAHPGRIDLARIGWVRPLLDSRWPQLAARALSLAGFIFTIAAGLLGPQVGSHNFAIIFVWIVWWTALKLAFIPLGGRAWCSVCPIPMPGEWLQRGGVLEGGARRFGLSRRWPKRLRGGWLQWGGFLLIGLFSAVTLTDPRITAWALLGLFVLATVLALVFERRAFCSHICPIGGFTGIYARTAPVEVRVLSSRVCADHSEKTCYTACPWGLYPLALKDSAQCGLCMECLRACPRDNIAVNLRPFGDDLAQPAASMRVDEAFLALMMLGSAVAFAAVFTGPWGALKSAAFDIGSSAWMAYAAGFLALNLVVLPGLFALAVWAGGNMNSTPNDQSKHPERRWSRSGSRRSESLNKIPGSRAGYRFNPKVFARQSQILLPLGLCAWIAFTISFAFPKFSYVLNVVSDPLGVGWNLFGTAGAALHPPAFGPALQAGILLLGVAWSARVAAKLAGENTRGNRLGSLPPLAFCWLFGAAMLWLLVG